MWMSDLMRKGEYSLHQENQRFILSAPDFSGFVKLSEIDSENKRCKWEINLPREQKDISRSIIMSWLVLEYLFEKQDLQKVQVEILATDQFAIDFHRRLGFCEEGRLSRQVLKDDKFVDLVLLSEFRETWEKKKKYLEEFLFESGVST